MKVSRVLNLAPTMTMAAAMAYAAYSIEPPAQAVPQAGTGKPGSAGSGDKQPNTIAGQSSAATDASKIEFSPRDRNPFVALVIPNRTAKSRASHEARIDPNLAPVKTLTLNATFIQGPTRYASINGRLYRQGQLLDGTDDKANSLVIAQVTPMQVTLEANGNRYILAYPEKLTAGVPSRPNAGKGARPTTGAAQHGARPGSAGRPPSQRR